MTDSSNRTDRPQRLDELFSEQIAAWPDAAPILQAWPQGLEQRGAMLKGTP